MDTNKCGENGAANLYSEWIERNKQRNCLDFYYLMNGRGVGVLQVYLRFQNGDTSLLWERIGDQGQEWKLGAATLPVTEKKYKVIHHFLCQNSFFIDWFVWKVFERKATNKDRFIIQS